MQGWRTILQLLARRAAESFAFSVPDRNALWSRAEDDLLVQAVAKYSTSNILGRSWIEVAWECLDACRNSVRSATGLLIFWRS